MKTDNFGFISLIAPRLSSVEFRKSCLFKENSHPMNCQSLFLSIVIQGHVAIIIELIYIYNGGMEYILPQISVT